MKILYLPGYRYPASFDEPLTSGDLRYSFTFSRALAQLGHEVTVISRKDKNDKLDAKIDGVRVVRYKSELEKIFSTSFDISFNRLRLFKKYSKGIDLIICNSAFSLEHFTKICAPIIYVASGIDDIKNYAFTPKEILGFIAIKLLRDPFKRWTWRRSVLVNTTAWHEDRRLIELGVDEDKVGKISSSVDLGRYYPIKDVDKLRNKLKINKNKVLLSVSRFTPAKGVIETVQAFDKLFRKDVTLLIVGVHHSHDSTYYDRLVEEINKSRLKENIILLENIPEKELPKYYSLADVVSVFSKMYDPLPTVLIEAMACGTPVVSTYYKTREQFIIDGENGLLVKEADLDDWVAKTQKLLDNDALRKSISEAGLKRVKENFDHKLIAEKYMRFLNNERFT